MKAVINGYHGIGNFGDDFFLAYITQELSSRGVENLYVAARPDSVHHSISRQYPGFKYILPRRRLFRGYDKILLTFWHALNADYLIFCAGSIFTILPEKLFFFLITVLRRLRPNLTIIAVGVSIGPFKKKSKAGCVIKALSKFQYVAVRDKQSLTYFQNLDSRQLRCFRDIAFTYNPPANSIKATGRLGICLNRYDSIFSPETKNKEFLRNTRIAASVSTAYKNSNLREIVLFSTCSNHSYGDIEIMEHLKSELSLLGVPSRLVAYNGNFNAFYTELTTCSGLIASRMHPGFFAAQSGSVVFQLAYAEKIHHFYESLNLNNISIHDPFDFSDHNLSQFLNYKIHVVTKTDPHLEIIKEIETNNYKAFLDEAIK